MACPLFVPVSPLSGFLQQTMPLGDLYGGYCEAQPSLTIPAETLQSCCNMGYARKCCARAAEAPADATRFLIKQDTGGALRVAWAMELDHHPVAVGVADAMHPGTGNAALDAQIQAYSRIAARFTRPRP